MCMDRLFFYVSQVFWVSVYASWSTGASARSRAPKCSFMSPAMTPAISSSSSMGTPFKDSSMARWPPSPIVPPRKILAPATAFILPSISRLAGAPMRPMSAACTWPQELGQPVQCTRMGRSASTRASTLAMTRSATDLVSTIASGQNWAPVHETMGPTTLPGSTDRRPSVSAGSARSASTSAAATFGRMRFCSTVMRTSPAE
mmetsp:Transcript_9404/g.28162  ORF Transcript_9404/g.28162 Transcript_9404/m.28162 type:complete len:202 (-) Transcript_9404:1404-2009(-)